MPAQHIGGFTILDYSEEKRSFKFNFGAITAVSIAGFLTQFGNLRTALTNFVLGTVQSEQWVGDRSVLSNVPPASSNAQGELKALISYEGDTTKKKYRMEVPTPDTQWLIAGTDKFDLTETEPAALVTALEAIGRTPDDDLETITVLDITLVGRNN